MMTYGTSIQKSTGATTFSLMFGREARLPIDVMFGSPPEEQPASPSQYVLLSRRRLEAAYNCERTQLSLQQRRKKTLYDWASGSEPPLSGANGDSVRTYVRTAWSYIPQMRYRTYFNSMHVQCPCIGLMCITHFMRMQNCKSRDCDEFWLSMRSHGATVATAYRLIANYYS